MSEQPIPSSPSIELPPHATLPPQLPPSMARHPVVAVVIALILGGAGTVGGTAYFLPSDPKPTIIEQGTATAKQLTTIQTSIGSMGGQLENLVQDVAEIKTDLKSVGKDASSNTLRIVALESAMGSLADSLKAIKADGDRDKWNYDRDNWLRERVRRREDERTRD